MTVGELKKRLKDLPDDTNVIVQGDEEGNFYHFLYSTELCIFNKTYMELAWNEEGDELLRDPKRNSLILQP